MCGILVPRKIKDETKRDNSKEEIFLTSILNTTSKANAVTTVTWNCEKVEDPHLEGGAEEEHRDKESI